MHDRNAAFFSLENSKCSLEDKGGHHSRGLSGGGVGLGRGYPPPCPSTENVLNSQAEMQRSMHFCCEKLVENIRKLTLAGERIFRVLCSRRGSKLCLSFPARPQPDPGPPPGPGSYNLPGSFDNVNVKSGVASSAFMSTTKRVSIGADTDSNLPGPGKFNFKILILKGKGTV